MASAMPVDLVLFDLDGTLVDTAPEIAETVNDVLAAEGMEPLPEADIRAWIGHGARTTLAQAYASRSAQSLDAVLGGSEIDRLFAAFARRHAEHVGTRSRLYPGVLTGLSRLAQMGIALALVTNKESRFVDAVLSVHGLSGRFEPVVAGDTLPVRKPDPAVIRYCLERHGTVPDRALLVGDSSVDVAVARAAGIGCWAVPYGYNGGRPIAEACPDRIVASIDDLPEQIAAVAPAS
ncbi:MAG: phosphoglycolate phosphatase [Nevskiales bacterium]|nr:phosphoglycolate phosphatase [Nevskiales bacterium]